MRGWRVIALVFIIVAGCLAAMLIFGNPCCDRKGNGSAARTSGRGPCPGLRGRGIDNEELEGGLVEMDYVKPLEVTSV